jgi:hypothetical protein
MEGRLKTRHREESKSWEEMKVKSTSLSSSNTRTDGDGWRQMEMGGEV